MSDVKEKAMLSLHEAASYMNISHTTVRRLLERGDLPNVRVGTRVLVPTSAIDAYITSAAVVGLGKATGINTTVAEVV